jgi:hypothetical protein|tara:strand:+ start:1077 stop:1298 length:222 start_codon:yes stop_codon:yes gene_type:complete
MTLSDWLETQKQKTADDVAAHYANDDGQADFARAVAEVAFEIGAETAQMEQRMKVLGERARALNETRKSSGSG